jgi:hypothetical protein
MLGVQIFGFCLCPSFARSFLASKLLISLPTVVINCYFICLILQDGKI